MKNIKPPKELIAKALNCDVNSINNEAGISKHPSWDSLGQLSVVVELEASYGLTISNDDILEYSDLQSITKLYKTLISNGE